MILETRIMCPKSWKCLFLLEENAITFQQRNITLNDEVKNNIKTAKINGKDELFYIFENIEKFIEKEDMGMLGSLINEIEGYFIPQIVLPIRFERVIKPLIYRELSNVEKLNKYKKELKESIKQYAKQLEKFDWFNKKNFSYLDITISTAIAVLDYLGEMPWQEEEAKEIYHWYLRIKSKNAFKVVLNETCPGLKAFANFTKIDF